MKINLFSTFKIHSAEFTEKFKKKHTNIRRDLTSQILENLLLSRNNRKGCQMVVVWQGCKQRLGPISKTYSCHCTFLIVLTFSHTPEPLKWRVSLNYQVLPKNVHKLVFFYIIYFSNSVMTSFQLQMYMRIFHLQDSHLK